jgi:hypothetical protein
LCNQIENFALTFGQFGEGIRRHSRTDVRKKVDQAAGDLAST